MSTVGRWDAQGRWRGAPEHREAIATNGTLTRGRRSRTIAQPNQRLGDHVEQLGQIALVLAAFAAVVVMAVRRAREDPIERLWIPIAAAILPMVIAWILTKDDQRALETAFLVWLVALGVVAWCVAVWLESGRVGSHVQAFREAIAISGFGALFGLSWYLFAGSTAQRLGLVIFYVSNVLAWSRYHAAKRGGWS